MSVTHFLQTKVGKVLSIESVTPFQGKRKTVMPTYAGFGLYHEIRLQNANTHPDY
jgi:hypothetical protein